MDEKPNQCFNQTPFICQQFSSPCWFYFICLRPIDRYFTTDFLVDWNSFIESEKLYDDAQEINLFAL